MILGYYSVPIEYPLDFTNIVNSIVIGAEGLRIIASKVNLNPDNYITELTKEEFDSYFPLAKEPVLQPTTDEKLDLLGQAIANLELQVALLSGGGA